MASATPSDHDAEDDEVIFNYKYPPASGDEASGTRVETGNDGTEINQVTGLLQGSTLENQERLGLARDSDMLNRSYGRLGMGYTHEDARVMQGAIPRYARAQTEFRARPICMPVFVTGTAATPAVLERAPMTSWAPNNEPLFREQTARERGTSLGTNLLAPSLMELSEIRRRHDRLHTAYMAQSSAANNRSLDTRSITGK